MDPLHAVYLTVGLFVITFFNPGANLFVVVGDAANLLI